LDLGGGEGKLLTLLLKNRQFEKITGLDVSHQSLQRAAQRLHLDTLPERQRQRLELLQGSLLYRDNRLAGYDDAALVEVNEQADFALAEWQEVEIPLNTEEFAALSSIGSIVFGLSIQGRFFLDDIRLVRAPVAGTAIIEEYAPELPRHLPWRRTTPTRLTAARPFALPYHRQPRWNWPSTICPGSRWQLCCKECEKPAHTPCTGTDATPRAVLWPRECIYTA
tara:strand:- start:155 stop:823 length:669 start_codon:yes stop_codon:yes gene_type:complete